MNSRQKTTQVLAFMLLMFGLTGSGALAQLCQVPLSIQKGDVDANIMILFDNSGSMNAAIEHAAYDPGTIFYGDLDETASYYVTVSGIYTVNGNDAYLVSAPNGQDGRYTGNYLNWVFHYATDEQRDALPTETRMDVAQAVIKGFIDRTSDVFMGLAKFNYDDGATILGECGTAPATLKTLVDGLAGDSFTPLGESMEDLLDYFMRTDGAAPIQYDCQKSFIIIITDGLPTMDLDVSSYLLDADGDGNDPGDCTSLGIPYDNSFACSDYMDDVAYWARHNDLIDWLGDSDESWEDGQTVVTYTIGYGVDHPLLEETALNGDGLYLSVNDSAELWSSLETIMVNVRQRVAAGAAVAVVSSESSDADFLYRGKYNPSQWMGFVECFQLPYEDKEQPVWDAGALLAARAADNRALYTVDGSTLMRFESDNAGRIMADMGLSTLDEARDVINWTCGESIEGYRRRDLGWKLGDVVHAAPVVVGAPSFFTDDMDFQDFIETGTLREKILYVGANDGMLHAFSVATGQEKWAFIPGYVQPFLRDIADSNYCHRFTVDLTPAVTDANLGGSWRTILISGEREGGPHYFALDITDTDAPGFLWEMTMPDNLDFGSEVEFATIAGHAVFMLGSGLDPSGGLAHLYVFDLATGNLLDSLELSSMPGQRNKATTPSGVDINFDEETDVAYVGDMSGTIHRVAFNGSLSSGSWSESELYSGNQPITAQPRAAYGESGDIYVYFGTGVYLDEPDILTTDQQSFYCVFDRHDGQSSSNLVDQTGSTGDIGSADGWFIDLTQKTGERVTEPAAIAAEMVFFTSYAPFSEPCRSGGESYFYRLDYDDGALVEVDARPGQRKFRGGGIASRPVLDIVNGTVIIQNSNQTITVEEIGATYSTLGIKSWQEDFSKVADPESVIEDDQGEDQN